MHMNKVICSMALLAVASPMSSSLVLAEELDATQVETSLRKVADYILDHPSGRDTRHWVIAPLYDGLLETAYVTRDAKYLETVLDLGIRSGWEPGPDRYHADDHAVGHAWLDIYSMDPSRKERLQPFVDRFDEILSDPRMQELDMRTPDAFEGVAVTDRWTWCDALYMAPPTLARLHAATGDRRYLDFMEQEYRFTYDRMWDDEEKLFFRDTRFIDRRTESGKKIFWSRGNGWVYGGLALTLDYLPEGYAFRNFLEELFGELTEGVLQAQQEDGLWRPSLRDPEQVPIGETSGSGFFTFGLAWGVNNGLLDREKYWPVVEQAWLALQTRIEESGRVGYVQRIGSAPDSLTRESTEDYGVGAYLLATAEVLRGLKGSALKEDRPRLLREAEYRYEVAQRKPQAFARLVPERKDDIAWENDKVAFRIYGPGLRDSTEDSGIDVWSKRVEYPVINRWYDGILNRKLNYHYDRGEGFDSYKVGSTRGCGGLGIWEEGQLLISNVYHSASVYWTEPERAEFTARYEYESPRWGTVLETKRIRLNVGERTFSVESKFVSKENEQPIAGLPIAIGLTSQSNAVPFQTDKRRGILSLWEPFHDAEQGLGVRLEKGWEAEAFVDVKDGEFEQGLMVSQTDSQGVIAYRSGFAWGTQGEITSAKEWLSYLRGLK